MIEKRVQLKHPITHGSEVINELVFARRPKAKDIKSMSTEPDMGEVLKVVGSLCGQPPSVIDEIDLEDIPAVTEVFGSFLGQAGPTVRKE